MKKAMNQSKLIVILNGASIFALLFMVLLMILYSRKENQLNLASEERFDLTYNANQFMNGSSYLTNEVRAYAATGKQEYHDNYMNEVDHVKSREKGIAAMQEIGITDEEQSMIDEMSALSNELVPLEENAIQNIEEGHRDEALEYVYGADYDAAITKINSLKEQFLETLDTRTQAQVKDLATQDEFIKIAMYITSIFVCIVQFFIMNVTRKRILSPVISVRDQMKEISGGNLSAEFALEADSSEIGMLVDSIHETKRELKKYINDIDMKLAQMADGDMDLDIGDDYRGEFLPIQNAMRQILDALNQALSKINTTAELVMEESERMSSDAQVLSNGAVEQSSAVQELTSGIQALSEQVKSTSEDADDARKSSIDAAHKLDICNQKMENLTAAMKDIFESSQQISGITKTIEDISFQTNILALNAAVEAARAGSAGKGFAVVADEVQSLANKSAEAAQNITKLIRDSIGFVEHGASLSIDTTETLADGVAGAQRSTELVERIAESAAKQAEAIEQLTQGMDQISGVVQTNASTAEKSASSAQELLGHAEELKVSIQKFRLRG